MTTANVSQRAMESLTVAALTGQVGVGAPVVNYNACKLGEGEPVTIGFSDAVGEILVSNPTVRQRSPKFKFYV